MKYVYQGEQQVKFLQLQAEVESLLYELQALKHQRLASANEASAISCTSDKKSHQQFQQTVACNS